MRYDWYTEFTQTMAAEDGAQVDPVSRVMANHVYISVFIHTAVLSPLYFVAVAVQNAQDGMMPRRCDI